MDPSGKEPESSSEARPRLVFLMGPLAGETRPWASAELTIGRVAANDLVLAGDLVSRRHARILQRDGSYVLQDLESRNGTSVNGIPIRKRELIDGDVIRIADHRFLFLHRADGPWTDAAIEDRASSDRREERGEIDAATVTMRLSIDSRDEIDAAPVAELDTHFGERVIRHLDALARLGDLLVADVETPALLEAVALHLAQVFPAEHVRLLLWDPESERLDPAASADHDRSDRDIPISWTIARKVAVERVSLLCSDALADRELGRAASVSHLGIRSVLCTPLVSRGRVLGVIYLENRSPGVEYTRHDLWLLRAMANSLTIPISQASLLESMRRRMRTLEEQAASVAPRLIGESAVLQETVRTARKAADSQATILILGESGTGKEVLARSVHAWSPRRTGPFVVVNCAALTDQLLQSDLFGHERGAFTGAVRQKKGRLEMADGGTIFLDEIGEIDREMQAKLLRFLQEHEFERLGGLKPIRVDVRVVAASNRDLAEEVKLGRFREDLYYRLRVVEVVMPPLRERRGDVRLLAQAFLEEFCLAMGKETCCLSDAARSVLERHDWPGNIRELRNCIERAVVLGGGPLLDADKLGLTAPAWTGGDASATGYRDQVRELKRRVIQAALDRAEGNQQRAAAALGLTPPYLCRLMKNLGMR